MRQILVKGLVILGLYLLFTMYLILYSERIEKLNKIERENSIVSFNYSE